LVSKKIPEQYLPLFADVIGYDRKTNKYQAKGFSTLNKKFISFVQIGNSNLNSIKGLQEASLEY
jgi:phage major head subunit gpT-like protein